MSTTPRSTSKLSLHHAPPPFPQPRISTIAEEYDEYEDTRPVIPSPPAPLSIRTRTPRHRISRSTESPSNTEPFIPTLPPSPTTATGTATASGRVGFVPTLPPSSRASHRTGASEFEFMPIDTDAASAQISFPQPQVPVPGPVPGPARRAETAERAPAQGGVGWMQGLKRGIKGWMRNVPGRTQEDAERRHLESMVQDDVKLTEGERRYLEGVMRARGHLDGERDRASVLSGIYAEAREQQPRGTPFAPVIPPVVDDSTDDGRSTRQEVPASQHGHDIHDEDATVVQHEPVILPPAEPVPSHREIVPSAAAAMSPESVVPSLASDYAHMAYSLRTPSEVSLRGFLGGLRGFVKDVMDLPWVASSRVTVDYVPGQPIRRSRHRPSRPVSTKRMSGREEPLDLFKGESPVLVTPGIGTASWRGDASAPSSAQLNAPRPKYAHGYVPGPFHG